MNTPCPCGSSNPYDNCCGKFIEQNQFAPTPEALMRSRYCAYVMGKVSYIAQTMQGAPLEDFNEQEIARWLSDVTWEGLKVIQTRLKNEALGFVSFEARYSQLGNKHAICEKSEFHKIGDKWFYVGGKALNPNRKW